MDNYGIEWADQNGLHKASTDNVCTLADMVSMVQASGATVSRLSCVSGFGRTTEHTVDGVLSAADSIRARRTA